MFCLSTLQTSTGRSSSITKEEDHNSIKEKNKDIHKSPDTVGDTGDICTRDNMAPVVIDNIEDENVLEKMVRKSTDCCGGNR